MMNVGDEYRNEYGWKCRVRRFEKRSDAYDVVLWDCLHRREELAISATMTPERGWRKVVRILSLRQPWACLVVHFSKNIENRTWNTHFRGEFLIHAAKGMTHREFDEAYEFARSVLGEARPTRQHLRPMLQFGGIIGCARVVDVVAPNPLGVVGWYPPGVNHRWHMREQFGFVLADVTPLPFRPCKGALGFFELKEDA
jgi:hypothetical protein